MSEYLPRRVGAPSRLTEETEERIISAVQGGSYLDDAAAYAGISYRTLCRWVERGRRIDTAIDAGEEISDEDRRYWQFCHALERARASAVIRNVATIQKAAQDGTWQAAAWYLERTNPKKWGRYETVQIDGSESDDTRATITSVLDERIARMRERASAMIEATGMPVEDAEIIEDEPAKGLRIAK